MTIASTRPSSTPTTQPDPPGLPVPDSRSARLDTPLPPPSVAPRREKLAPAWRRLTACIVVASLITLLPLPPNRNGGPDPKSAVQIVAFDPRPALSASDTDVCTRAVSWRHMFPSGYLGEVYALISAGPHTAVPTRITLSWGRWQWQGNVNAAPGMVHLRTGGTLLLFAKTGGATGRNPDLTVESHAPICVQFGTALDGPVQPMAVINANPGWIFRSTPYT
jgi:hypothetical protein